MPLTSQSEISNSDLESLMSEIFIDNYDNVKNRSAGSSGERDFANILAEKLSSKGFEFLPNSESFIQSFQISNDLNSQNVVGFINNNSQNNIILSAHYDSIYKEDMVGETISYGFNDNLSGVIGVLSLTEILQNLTPQPNFNIIVAFYGAEEIGCKGSEFFMEKLASDIKSKILLAINFDSIGAGDFLYYYHSDFPTTYGESIDVLANSNDALKKLGFNRLFTTLTGNGLNYSNIGLKSDNASHLKNGINSLFFFAGNLDSFNGLGFFEKQGEQLIMHKTDSKETIDLIFGETYYNNIANTVSFCFSVLTDDNFNETNFYAGQINSLIFSDWILKASGVLLIIIIIIIFKTSTKIKRNKTVENNNNNDKIKLK
ncbi:MAG: M20/M25/M40 family metallo-hydrolase [Clostridia bacterium]|nr:M20/M25/M40 family metallo-hydrolase [Clostridia bacterium]